MLLKLTERIEFSESRFPLCNILTVFVHFHASPLRGFSLLFLVVFNSLLSHIELYLFYHKYSVVYQGIVASCVAHSEKKAIKTE